ncbi:hypothetical protein [uncultured Eubacterium sp.]|uniref:hypothetical protein n=1 Tax=uncultured Eubacterium sp. TaxID=165185 RepID=UPI0025992BF6|nr:hypothetical protein [uncultured Eubacterium sp.]
MIVKVFNRDYLKNELNLPCEAITDKIIDTTRWSVVHEIVFADNGKFYQTTYSEAATEIQDEEPWDYEEEVECIEVKLREVKVKKWMPVEE